MVAQDVATFWDLKPNRENTNVLFNVLCNVQPVEHPRSGDGYARQIDVTHGSKENFWLEKCKGLKRCKLYEYECDNCGSRLVIPKDDAGDERSSLKKRRNEKLRSNANFTDVIVFQGYRLYMRKNDLILNPYGDYGDPTSKTSGKRYPDIQTGKRYVDGGGDGDEDTCDHVDKKGNTRTDMHRPSEIIEQYPVDKTIIDKSINDDMVNTFNTAGRIRIYIQPIDTKGCSGDSFDDADESPIILVKEYEASPCNPDKFIMGYGGIGVPDIIDDADIYMIFYGGKLFSYFIPKGEDVIDISEGSSIYLNDYGVYIDGIVKPSGDMEGILADLGIPLGGYFTSNAEELSSYFKHPDIIELAEDSFEIDSTGMLYSYKESGDIPYFATGNSLTAINGFFSLSDKTDCSIPSKEDIQSKKYKKENIIDEGYCNARDVLECSRRIFLFDSTVDTSTLDSEITSISKYGGRIAMVSGNHVYISGNGKFIGTFSKDTSVDSNSIDRLRGSFPLPIGVNKVKEVNGMLLFLGPKTIVAPTGELGIYGGSFTTLSDNNDGYFSGDSFFNDDGEFLLLRRGKVLGTLGLSVSYNYSVSLSFDPNTGYFVNSHIKSLNNDYNIVNIDADINNRYVSIYDENDVGEHYSKILIYDKHYKFWHHWMITGARIIHVKDGIFLGDGIYVNKGRTWGRENDDTEGGEIIEIISAYIGDEGLQTPKHIQYVKTAIGDHSVITNDSYRDIDTSYGGRLFERRNNITTTRYPKLLLSKDSEKQIETYEIGEEIYGHGKLLSHNLINEISEYRNYDKFSKLILREMGEDNDMKSTLARFASIKEPINAPANVLELCISARHLDNVQFGSFYIGYYQLDADYEDIENTNIDTSGVSDRTKEYETVINRGEYCDEILEGSVCDTE